jgi:adenylate cyclase
VIDTVRLDPALLPEFREKQNDRLLRSLRVSLLAGAVVSLLFIPWEYWHDPEQQAPGALILLSLAAFLAVAGGITFLQQSRAYLGAIAVMTSLVTASSISLLHVVLTDGFMFGVGMLLTVMVVTTVLSVDLSLLAALALPTMLVAIPNVAMAASGASFLTFMNTNWVLVPAAFLSAGLAFLIDQAHRRSFMFEKALARERDRSENLLQALLPSGIAEQLKDSQTVIADVAPDATVAFADLVGFTALSERLGPHELITTLTEIFTALDRSAERHGLEKIKTIGDAYMVGAGVADAQGSDARSVATFAFDAVRVVQEFSERTGLDLDVRVGVASGPVVCGVIGFSKPHFDLWGTTVNRASRLEVSAPAGSVHIDMVTAARLGDGYSLGPCRQISLYGIGEVDTCILLGKADFQATTRTASR